MSWPINEDWYYDQGDDKFNEDVEETEDICSECEYTNCQCDAADDYFSDMMDDR
jgi:hypothetical protein